MPTVTLLTKVYDGFQLKLVDNFLKSTLKGLRVKIEACEVTRTGWVQMALSGEDEKVALRYLADEIGLCPTRLENVEKNAVLNGRLTSVGRSRNALSVDVGVSSPEVVDATIPLQQLQAQLVDGRKVALKKIVELFGFCENLPLITKVSGISEENRHIGAVLSEKQLSRFMDWTRSLLDRLMVIGSSDYEVRVALKRASLKRDVVGVEHLGLFEHAVVCKLGTDAKGLIPRIGRNLRDADFSIFSPRKILEFLGPSFSYD
jgi:hypothetical protein